MRLDEISKSKKEEGTYVAVRFSKQTEKSIRSFITENDIPGQGSIDDNGGVHSTIVYSRKNLKDFKPKGKHKKKVVKASGFTKIGPNDRCLVLELDAPMLVQRHKQIRKDFGATHDFDDYIPHITLSTDAKNFDEKKLPAFTSNIEIVEEYSKPIDF